MVELIMCVPCVKEEMIVMYGRKKPCNLNKLDV